MTCLIDDGSKGFSCKLVNCVIESHKDLKEPMFFVVYNVKVINSSGDTIHDGDLIVANLDSFTISPTIKE